MSWDLANPFVIDISVVADDIDGLGHANNAVYVSWLERCAWRHSQYLGLDPAQYPPPPPAPPPPPPPPLLTSRPRREAPPGANPPHGTVESAVFGQIEPQVLRVAPGAALQPADIDRVIGMTEAVDVVGNHVDIDHKWICQVPTHRDCARLLLNAPASAVRHRRQPRTGTRRIGA